MALNTVTLAIINELSRSFPKIAIQTWEFSKLVVIKNSKQDSIIELVFTDNGIIIVDYYRYYSNTGRRVRFNNARLAADLRHDENMRIKKSYNIVDPNFIPQMMADLASHIKRNQPPGTRSIYKPKDKARHGN